MTIPLCNRADWGGGDLTYSYHAYDFNGQAIDYEGEPVEVPEAPGIVPGDGPTWLNTLGNYGFTNKTGVVSVLTTGGAKLLGVFLFVVNNGGLAIGNLLSEISVTIEDPLGQGKDALGNPLNNAGVDMNDTRSLYVKLSRPVGRTKKGSVELAIIKTGGADEQNYAEFPDGLPIILGEPKTLLFVEHSSIIWLEGYGPSPANLGQNFEIRIIQNRVQKGAFPFRVYNTEKAFSVMDQNQVQQPIRFILAPLGLSSVQNQDPACWVQEAQNPGEVDTVFLGAAHATFSALAVVTIDIPNGNNAPGPGDFQIGFVQNLLSLTSQIVYEKGQVLLDPGFTPPLPLIDGAVATKPWYGPGPLGGGPPVPVVFSGLNAAIINTNDGPCLLAKKVLNNDNANRVSSLRYQCSYRDWIVVQYIKQNDPDRGATQRIWHADWGFDYWGSLNWNANPPGTVLPQTVHPAKAEFGHVSQPYPGVPLPGAPQMVTSGPTADEARKK